MILQRYPISGPKGLARPPVRQTVGARPILIAYNVNLDSQDLLLAKKIAKKIRERDGGLLAVKGPWI